jgi:hypothetical protein
MLIVPINVISTDIDFLSINPKEKGCLEIDYIEKIIKHTNEYNNQNGKQYAQSNNELILSLIGKIDENIYLGYLENLTSFGPRVTSTQECDDSAEYIFNEFEKLGLETRYHDWSNDYLYGRNVEATFHGSDNTSDEIYIICAHYDTIGGCPGADDDGSSVAAVMTAANVMSSFSFNHTIRFLAFSGEEQGLLGSGYYVQDAVENNDNIVAALTADMIGFAISIEDENIIKLYENDESGWLAEFTIDVDQQYNDYIDLEIMRSGYIEASDHSRFWEGGYNAILFSEYHFNEFFHSPEDTIENMNIPYALKTTKLIITILAELSEISVSKNAPLKPKTPSGKINGKIGEEYYYITSTTGMNGDILYYYWDWGDGTNSDWIGPYNSGEEVNISHIWNKIGSYSIRVKAKNDKGYESEWSNPLSISMPRNNQNLRLILLNIILKDRFFRIYF